MCEYVSSFFLVEGVYGFYFVKEPTKVVVTLIRTRGLLRFQLFYIVELYT